MSGYSRSITHWELVAMVYKFSNTLRKFLLQVKNCIYGLEDKYFMNEDICLPQGSFLLYIEPLYLYGYVYLLSIINIIWVCFMYMRPLYYMGLSKLMCYMVFLICTLLI